MIPVGKDTGIVYVYTNRNRYRINGIVQERDWVQLFNELNNLDRSNGLAIKQDWSTCML